MEPLTDDSAAVTFDVPAELAETFAFTPGQSLTMRRGRRATSAGRTRSAPPAGEAPRIGVREVAGGAGLRLAGARACGPATRRGTGAVRLASPGPRRTGGEHVLHRGGPRDHAGAVDRRVAARPRRRLRHPALRQPAHRHGDVRRRGRRPQGRATRRGCGWSTCCPARRRRSSCSTAGWTPTKLRALLPVAGRRRTRRPLVAVRPVRDGQRRAAVLAELGVRAGGSTASCSTSRTRRRRRHHT